MASGMDRAQSITLRLAIIMCRLFLIYQSSRQYQCVRNVWTFISSRWSSTRDYSVCETLEFTLQLVICRTLLSAFSGQYTWCDAESGGVEPIDTYYVRTVSFVPRFRLLIGPPFYRHIFL
jgi:hypothetical protein